MFDALRARFTEHREVQFGVFDTSRGQIMDEMPWVDKLPPDQLAQGQVNYWRRRLLWRRWRDGMTSIEDNGGRLRNDMDRVIQEASNKFRPSRWI